MEGGGFVEWVLLMDGYFTKGETHISPAKDEVVWRGDGLKLICWLKANFMAVAVWFGGMRLAFSQRFSGGGLPQPGGIAFGWADMSIVVTGKASLAW